MRRTIVALGLSLLAVPALAQQSSPSVTFHGDVTVGTVLPDTVQIIEIPKFKKYSYVILNNKKVLVDASTRKVIAVY